jgi:hypothetical protein
LGFVDLAIVAHFNSTTMPNNRAKILKEVISGEGFPVHGLQDDAALVVVGSEQKFIGTPPLTIQSTKA